MSELSLLSGVNRTSRLRPPTSEWTRTFVARLAAYLASAKGLILIGCLGQTLGEQ